MLMKTDFWTGSLSEVTTDMTEDLSIYRFYTGVVGMTDQEYLDFLYEIRGEERIAEYGI